MKIGFTGTRRGMSERQVETLFKFLREATEFHHGRCLGADEQALRIAKIVSWQQIKMEYGGIWTVAHPSNLSAWTSQVESDETREPKPPLLRNQDIVNECSRLLACPGGMAEVIRSGTWSTIRYARGIARDRRIIWPDGSYTNDN